MPASIKNKKVPKHLAVILDGNRRFARKKNLHPWKGHDYGAKKLKKFIEWCRDLGIKEITLFCFSIDNFKRPKEEIDFLFSYFRREFTALLNNKENEDKEVNINFIGRLNLFPDDIQELMKKNMEKSRNYSKYKINFAMGYSGRTEIVDAVKKIAEQVEDGKLNPKEINEETINNNIYLKSNPDLIIRTSESRLSGFLLWQSAYSEIIFLPDIMWPEMTKTRLLKCIKEFEDRERRFGQ